MTTPRRPRLAPLAVGALLLASPLLAACGSDTAEDAAGTSTATSSASPTDAPTTSDPSASADASGSASTSPTETPTEAPSQAPTIPPGTPDCASVWTAGGTIPDRYKGCAEDGAYVRADVLGCSSGQRIVRYADRFYGVPGGTISASDVKLVRDPGYRKTVAGCRG